MLPLLSLGIPGFSSLSGGVSQVQYHHLRLLRLTIRCSAFLVLGKLLFTVLIFEPILNPRHVLHPVSSTDGEPSGCKALPSPPIFP